MDNYTPGRMPVKEDDWIPAIGMDTPIEYLVPTTSNAGVCTTALVDFLTLTHNDFIERCQSLISSDRSVHGYANWNRAERD